MSDAMALAASSLADPPPPHPPGPWLHSARFDVAWYLGVPLALVLLYPWAAGWMGPKGGLWVYALSAGLTGLPHNALTWWLLLPERSRARYGSGVLWGPMLLTAAVLIPLLCAFGTPAFAYPLGLVLGVAYFHIVRQHQGLLHLADLRLAQGQEAARAAARAWGRALRHAVGWGALALALLKLTGPQPHLGLGQVPMAFPFWPAPPWAVAVAGLAFALALGWALVRLLAWRRLGGPWPWLHAAITAGVAAILGAAYLVPNEAFFLSLALVSGAHNLQYMGFVWTHHRQRAEAEPDDADPMTRWARERRWLPYFGVMVACGLGVAAAASLLPGLGFMLLLNWFMISHYFVDGAMWRRKHYPAMARFAARPLAP